MQRKARASRYRVAAFAPRARATPPTVAPVQPSLDPFQLWPPEIYLGIARSWPIAARVTTRLSRQPLGFRRSGRLGRSTGRSPDETVALHRSTAWARTGRAASSGTRSNALEEYLRTDG